MATVRPEKPCGGGLPIAGDRVSGVGAPQPGAGLRVLVPGYAQWGWRQRERALVLFGSYAASVVVAAFAWGTPTGLAVLAFAFATHVVSAADAVRQNAFPAPGLGPTVAGVSGGLAVGVYAPVLTAATLLAWPGMRGGSDAEGFLVNCRAYRQAAPKPDDLIWYRPTPWGEPRVGRVVAGGGQEVEWSDNRLRVDGRSRNFGPPSRTPRPPTAMAYRVPDGQVLVSPEAGPGGRRASDGVLIVDRDQIIGRVWARMYPVRERRLLR